MEPQQKTETGNTTIQHELALLRDHLDARILGQKSLISRLLIALLADGHLLVEGAPGLPKQERLKN